MKAPRGPVKPESKAIRADKGKYPFMTKRSGKSALFAEQADKVLEQKSTWTTRAIRISDWRPSLRAALAVHRPSIFETSTSYDLCEQRP
jgi:hypothetical protein